MFSINFTEYVYVFSFLLISFLISLCLFIVSVIGVYQRPENENMSVYECGFNPFNDARNNFEVNYYIVGILFIIFDLEISYLFPFVIGWWNLNVGGIWTFVFFIFLLLLGFLYDTF